MSSQAGKTVLITGANSGVGFQAAVELARHGAHVLLGVRDTGKGEQAIAELRRTVPEARVETALVDMASLDSIRRFAEAFDSGKGSDGQGGGRPATLDVLINNAGVMALPQREVTPDGFERQFGTNHLGHFALTGLLLPALLRAGQPRVVTVSSLAHRNGAFTPHDLHSEGSYQPMTAYNNSKLANLLFAKELDRRARAAGWPLLSIAVHPGVSRTRIFANGPAKGRPDLRTRLMMRVAPILMQSDAQGALPLEFAATSPDARSGDYIGPNGFGEIKGHPKVVQPRAHALDQAAARQLWEISEKLTGVTYP